MGPDRRRRETGLVGTGRPAEEFRSIQMKSGLKLEFRVKLLRLEPRFN
jgi:hypothetical protein